MEPITTASVLTALGAAVAGVIKDELTKAIVAGVQQQVNPSVVKKALVAATDAANRDVPALFYRCEMDGRLGIAPFLNQYFAGAAMPELRKPFDSQVKPDVACLKLAFEQALGDYSKREAVAVEALEDWLKVFAEVYFKQTHSALTFAVARADYCEQLRQAFDAVKFGGIAVDGQEIDRAEKLADIFVMPDVREDAKGKSPFLPPSPEDEVDVLNVDGEITVTFVASQTKLLREQRREAAWRREQEKGQIVSAKALFNQTLLKQSRRAVLLGAPGSGKTTLMSYWAVTTCAGISPGEAVDSGLPVDCLPILIRIRELAKYPKMAVLKFVQDFAECELSTKALPKGFFEYWLENGQALILLDGLDEVADTAQRYQVVEKIEAFLNEFKDNLGHWFRRMG